MKAFTAIHAATGLLVQMTQEDGWFIADVPALPGCVSQGRTLGEVCANISEAIADVLEVMADVDPAGYAVKTGATTPISPTTTPTSSAPKDVCWVAVAAA